VQNNSILIQKILSTLAEYPKILRNLQKMISVVAMMATKYGVFTPSCHHKRMGKSTRRKYVVEHIFNLSHQPRL